MTPEFERMIFILLLSTFLAIMGWLIVQLVKAKDEKTNQNGIAIKELAQTFGKMAQTLEGLNQTLVAVQLTMAKEYVTKEELRQNCIERRSVCRTPQL